MDLKLFWVALALVLAGVDSQATTVDEKPIKTPRGTYQTHSSFPAGITPGELIFNGRVIYSDELRALKIAKLFDRGDNDVLLLETTMDGTANCSPSYLFISVSSKRVVRRSREFGNCGYYSDISQVGEIFTVKLPREYGSKEIYTYDVSINAVVDTNPVHVAAPPPPSAPPQNDFQRDACARFLTEYQNSSGIDAIKARRKMEVYGCQ